MSLAHALTNQVLSENISKTLLTEYVKNDQVNLNSLEQSLEYSAQKFPDKQALSILARANSAELLADYDYASLVKQVRQAANHLASLGVKPGDAVIYLSPSTAEAMIYFLAIPWVGAVAPINPLLADDVIANITNNLQAKVLIAASQSISPVFYAKARYLKEHCPLLQTIVVDGEVPDCETLSWQSMSIRKSFSDSEANYEHLCADDLAAFYHTGGTTGVPNIAKLTQRNVLTGCLSSALCHDLSSDYRVLNGLPLFHVGGGLICIIRPLLLGQTLVQFTPWGFRAPGLVEHFWTRIVELNISQLISVPTIYNDILKVYDGRKTNLQLLISGASKLPVSLSRKCKEQFGLEVLEGFGMTECSGFCASNVVGMPVKPGSAGKTSPFYQVRIVKIQAGEIIRDCAINESGLLIVRGEAVFAGYSNKKKNRSKFLEDKLTGLSWMNTEDLGFFDEDDYLFIVGREKDIIIRSGHNIDPFVIEETLLKHEDIVEVAAVGMPDERTGELPIAFVVMAQDKTLDEPALRDWCRDNISEAGASPIRIIALEALPRTAMNKVFKPELVRRAVELAANNIVQSVAENGSNIQIIVDRSHEGQLTLQLLSPNGDDHNIPQTERLAAISALEFLGLTVN